MRKGDYFSKWPEAATCESVTSSAVIDFLNGLFDRYGLVEEISTDNGPQFTSSEFSSYLQGLRIRHCLSAYYSPQSNAEVERFNRVMKEGLRTGLADGRSFITAARQTLAAYRTTPHVSTGVTPASLFLAFPVRTPLSMLPLAVASSQQPAPSNSSSSSLPSAAQSSQSVRSKVSFAQSRMSADHDRRHRAKLPLIKSRDSSESDCRSWHTSWRRGILNLELLSRPLATQFGFRTVSAGMCDDACFIGQYSSNQRRK